LALNESSAYRVVGAAPDQTAAVLALLPELMSAQFLPPRFVVAHAADDAARLLGAAAYVPMVGRGHLPGFRSQCRVLPAFRRRGIGRALTARLGAEVLQWGVTHLHSWAGHRDGAEVDFLKSVGGQAGLGMHHFVGDTAVSFSICRRLVTALIDHRRVPPACRLLPMADAPLDAVALLYCSQFGGSPTAARQMIEQVMAQEMGRSLSYALWDGNMVAGFLLGGAGADMPELKYWVTDPTIRTGWPAIMLLDAFLAKLSTLGIQRVRYHCNDKTQATLNAARKTGAVLEAVFHTYVLDLSIASPS
jgi:GNAT superfamily N-acetyltransferase